MILVGEILGPPEILDLGSQSIGFDSNRVRLASEMIVLINAGPLALGELGPESLDLIDGRLSLRPQTILLGAGLCQVHFSGFEPFSKPPDLGSRNTSLGLDRLLLDAQVLDGLLERFDLGEQRGMSLHQWANRRRFDFSQVGSNGFQFVGGPLERSSDRVALLFKPVRGRP